MESSRYWQVYEELKKNKCVWSASTGNISAVTEGKAKEVFIHAGRQMPFEVYLSVPTFIRRGLSIAK